MIISNLTSKIENSIKYQKAGIMKKWNNDSMLKARYKCERQIYVSQIVMTPTVTSEIYNSFNSIFLNGSLLYWPEQVIQHKF